MKKYIQRFEELSLQLRELEHSKHSKNRSTRNHNRQPYEAIDSELLDKWKINVKSLLANACRNDSEQYKAFNEIIPDYGHHQDEYDTLKKYRSAFNAAKEDYLGGYCASAKSLVEAEVFTSQIEQAKVLFDAGYYVAAAIISGVVLETHLREMCVTNDIPTVTDKGKTVPMDKMNADLAKSGIYTAIIQKQITGFAAIRNSAAHGKADDAKEGFKKEQVITMIQGIKNILEDSLN